MARMRTIKPESCLSETLAGLSDRACLLFAYLPCFCDDEGRMRYSAALVKAQAFPLRDAITVDTCAQLVAELSRAGLVSVYEIDSKRYLQVCNFKEHQHPQKPKPSVIPAPVPSAYVPGSVLVPEGAESADAPAETLETADAPDEYGTDTGLKGSGREVVEESREDEGKGKATVGQARQIVTYLNHKTGKNFKHTTKQTRSLINARIAEGFTVDDFHRVIDNKVAEWARDPKMAAYLRPETLFGAKFEGYLQQRAAAKGGGYEQYD